MKIFYDVIFFKSNEMHYEKEKNGDKSNTERLMSWDEYEEMNESIPKIKRIMIESLEIPSERFEREITDITTIGEIFGNKIVIFSWRHE